MISNEDLLKAQINFFEAKNALSLADENVINDQIAADQLSTFKKEQLIGESYYFNKADITLKTRKEKTAPNNKIQCNYHKLLVDQKVAYLVGKPPAITSSNPDHSIQINKILNERWDDILNSLAKKASNKGKEYLQPFIDEEGGFGYQILDSREIIVIYDKWDRTKIIAFIRYIEFINENGKIGLQIEYWDAEKVTYFVKEDMEAMVIFDASREINPQAHFTYSNGIDEVKSYGWGRCPIIEIRNNDEMLSDLTPSIKSLIDDYNNINSHVSDDIAELQQAIYIIKNYMGTDLAEFKQRMIEDKIATVGPDGGVEFLTLNIPIDAVERTLQRRETDIFTTAQGVNTKNDIFNNAPSGVTLKQLYQALDQKCSTFERKLKKAIIELTSFITQYILITTDVDYSMEEVKVVFNKQMLVNQLEQIDMIALSTGLLSKKTLLENHPWVDDVDEELRRIEEENGGMIEDNSSDSNSDMPMTENADNGATIDSSTVNQVSEVVANDPQINLNGAQMQSLLNIIQNVKSGTLDYDSALTLITSAFPFSEEKARKILGQLG